MVDSYLAYNGEFKRGENSKLRKSLAGSTRKDPERDQEKRDELKSLYRKSTVKVRHERDLTQRVWEGERSRHDRHSAPITEEQRQQIASEMVKTDLDLIKAQAISKRSKLRAREKMTCRHDKRSAS